MGNTAKVGYIYILTNEAFHQKDWIKIGYTKNVAQRIKDLSNTSVPCDFQLYAQYEIPESPEMEKSDKELHKLICMLDPDLRINDKREFFKLDPEDAYALLYSIAKIHGRTDKLTDGPGRKEYINETNTSSRANLPKMKWCLDNGLIKVGDRVFIKGNVDEVATVVDDKKVNYNGEEMSYNTFGCKIMGWKTIQIYSFLITEGETKTLGQKRQEKMEELGL